MKRIVPAVVASCIAGLSICLATTAGAEPAEPEEAVVVVTAQQREALGIALGRATPRTLVPRPNLPGRVVLPNERVHVVTARSEGVLLMPAVAVGDLVEAGQELARIESPRFVALQREYLESLSQRDLAAKTAEREAELAREGIIPGRRALDSAALLLEARARLAEANQALVLSGMHSEEIEVLARRRRLESNLVLRAPLDAVVLEQFARAGERLEAGGALYRIGDPTALAVEIHVPLDLARLLEVGTRFRLPQQAAAGRVIAIGSEVHALDQGVLVRGRVEGEAALLRPGQFVSVQFETPRQKGDAYAVPAAAIVHANDRAWIFERVEDGFRPVAVEPVGGTGRERVVVGRLSAGTELAIRGTAALKAYWLSEGGPR